MSNELQQLQDDETKIRLKKANQEVGYRLKKDSPAFSFICQKIHNVLVALTQKSKKGELPVPVRYRVPDQELYWWAKVDDVILGAGTAKDGENARAKAIQGYFDILQSIRVERDLATRDPGSLQDDDAVETLWSMHHILGDVQVINSISSKKGQRGGALLVGWNFPAVMEKYLLDPKSNYTWLALKYQNLLPNLAALVMYEICKRYESMPRQGEPRAYVDMSVDEWHSRLCPSREKRMEYRFFKRDIVQKSIDAINAHTDIQIELEAIRSTNSATISRLRLYISQPAQKRLIDEAPRAVDVALADKLLSIGLTDSTIQKIYDEYGEQKIKDALGLVTKRAENSTLPALESPAAYFYNSLKKDFAGAVVKAREISNEAIEKKKTAAAEAKAKAAAEREEQAKKLVAESASELPTGDELARVWALYREKNPKVKSETFEQAKSMEKVFFSTFCKTIYS